jgi:hypothetical protein
MPQGGRDRPCCRLLRGVRFASATTATAEGRPCETTGLTGPARVRAAARLHLPLSRPSKGLRNAIDSQRGWEAENRAEASSFRNPTMLRTAQTTILSAVFALVILLAAGACDRPDRVQRTREELLKADLYQMRDAIDRYHHDKSHYPASVPALLEPLGICGKCRRTRSRGLAILGKPYRDREANQGFTTLRVAHQDVDQTGRCFRRGDGSSSADVRQRG